MIKKSAAQPGSAKWFHNPHRVLRVMLIVTAYLFAFIILDFITKQFEELPGIVAWYPPAGLTYTLLLVFGVGFSPAVMVALFISSLMIYRMPQPPYLLFVWAFILSFIYSGAAAFLRLRVRFDWQLRKFRDVTWFVFTTVLVSGLLAVLTVSSSALSSDMPRSEVLSAIFHWWIGETVGVLTVAPFLLIYVMPGLKRLTEGQPVRLSARRSFPRPTLSAIGQASSLVLMLYWVFGAPVLDQYQPMYLITLPLIWIALHRGIKGVAAAIVALNFGVVLALWFFRFDLARLNELQLLMVVNGIVCLLMGAVVTERKQVEVEIQSRTDELTTLYHLSRALSDANDLEKVFELVTRHTVESVRATFAIIALLEDGDLVPRAVYQIRNVGHDFSIGDRQPVTALPVCQRVLNNNEPLILQNGSPEVSRSENAILLLDFTQSVCLVPLRVGDSSQPFSQALGLLILGEAREERREPFTSEKICLARSIGDQAAATIRRLLSLEQARRRLKHLASLSEIDRTIASNFDLRITLPMILKHISEQLEVDAADVRVFDDRMRTLEWVAGCGFHSPGLERTRLRLEDSLAGQAVLDRHIVQIQDVTARGAAFAQFEWLKAEKVVTYFAVPLITKGQVIGVLEIFHRTPLTPNEEALDFLNALAGQAVIAIENVQLFNNLQRSTDELELAYDATIEGWSHALDLRDKETEGHTLRVAEMTVKLARAFGLSEVELVQVRWGALLHDIGKMGVPDSILLKPGPLTDEEWVVMKRHPVLAFEMLSPIHYLHLAQDIPYCHHEKWDGTGYPRGLKVEQIPLVARIFAVVDVWDALTSDRPYRKAWSTERAIEQIKSGSGTHFDPQVVEVFFLDINKEDPTSRSI